MTLSAHAVHFRGIARDHGVAVADGAGAQGLEDPLTILAAAVDLARQEPGERIRATDGVSPLDDPWTCGVESQ